MQILKGSSNIMRENWEDEKKRRKRMKRGDDDCSFDEYVRKMIALRSGRDLSSQRELLKAEIAELEQTRELHDVRLAGRVLKRLRQKIRLIDQELEQRSMTGENLRDLLTFNAASAAIELRRLEGATLEDVEGLARRAWQGYDTVQLGQIEKQVYGTNLTFQITHYDFFWI